MMNFPRTLLLTVKAPDARYGYKAIRELVGALPSDRIVWCSMASMETRYEPPCRHCQCAPKPPHWRFKTSACGLFYRYEFQSRRVARRIKESCADFRPQLLWVMSEWGAAPVGRRLASMLAIPVHMTVHDAHETARFFVPSLYYPLYIRSLHGLAAASASMDAVSLELLDHIRQGYPQLGGANSLVLAPSVSDDAMKSRSAAPSDFDQAFRRIGFCGTLRTSAGQWESFLRLLGDLPFRLEIVAFTERSSLPAVDLPGNVSFKFQEYVKTEKEVVRSLRDQGVYACYLGLWREPERRLFARTSLSAKLSTYAAAALPVIVDGPRDAAAWRLVEQYGAGILCEDRSTVTARRLKQLFADSGSWKRMSQGAAVLCREEFSLERNVARFGNLLARYA